MKDHHLLFYDEFDDPVLDSLHDHIPNRGTWDDVNGHDDHTHLVYSELRLDGATFPHHGELLLMTPNVPVDVRIEALFHFLAAAEEPYFGIYARTDEHGSTYAGMTVWPKVAGAIYATWHTSGVSHWDEQNLAWGSIWDCDIYTELTLVGRELSCKFVNLTIRNETVWHYTIPENAGSSLRQCALRLVPNANAAFAEHGVKYFKVFGADKAE